MKLRTVFMGPLILAVALAGSATGCRRVVPAQAGEKASKKRAFVEVETLMKDPDGHRGPIRIVGVVRTVSKGKKTLALIDRREFMKCALDDCAKYVLPVQWDGLMPAVKDEILLKGEIGEADGKLLFIAEELKKRPKPKAREES